MHRLRRAAIALGLTLPLAPTSAVHAQCGSCAHASVRDQAVLMGVNALIGGATTAVRARMQRRPAGRALLGGAAGGALTYAGKRIVVEHGTGAGLLGREVAAVGTSLSANAAEGRGIADRVVLPFGPVRLYVAMRGSAPRVGARVDAAALAAAAYAATVPGARFDTDASLSAGALVFRVERETPTNFDGRHLAGVLLVHETDDEAGFRRVSAHERVHVLQYDQSFLLWSAPAEARLANRAGWTRSLHRWVDLGLNAPVLAGLGAIVPYRIRPWESEARILARLPDAVR